MGISPNSATGSSPLTRGALANAVLANFLNLDHPRSRGEHITFQAASRIEKGSSPLTRGAPRRCRSSTSVTWIIPAHAGSTVGHTPAFDSRRDHPRSRGEHWR